MCNQAADDYADALEHIPDSYRTKKKWVIKMLILVVWQ